jgi:hypothetical protein
MGRWIGWAVFQPPICHLHARIFLLPDHLASGALAPWSGKQRPRMEAFGAEFGTRPSCGRSVPRFSASGQLPPYDGLLKLLRLCRRER